MPAPKTRSASDWAKLAGEPLLRLRAEVRDAVIDVRSDLGGRRPKLNWQELIQGWRPGVADWRTIEQRWRRSLEEVQDIDNDIMNLGEILQALHNVRERLQPGKLPRVRRMLHDEPEPGARLLETLYPGGVVGQDVSGLEGVWRLVQSRSDGEAFIVWRLSIMLSHETDCGPGAWFRMETAIPPRTPGRGRRNEITAAGAAHAVGATFHLIGTDNDRRPVTASFELQSGLLPKDPFENAQGIIQRIGTRGVYAARTIVRRAASDEEVEVGDFTLETATGHEMETLAEDIAILSAMRDPAGPLPYILADNG